MFVCSTLLIGKGETNTQGTRVELRKRIDGGKVRLLQVKDWFYLLKCVQQAAKAGVKQLKQP